MADVTESMIPDAVVEAACIRRYGEKWTGFHPRFSVAFKDLLRAQMRRDILAALNAWPGAYEFRAKGGQALSLPLPVAGRSEVRA